MKFASIKKLSLHSEESQKLFSKIFNDGPIGMAIVGLDFKFVKANKLLCNMLGYSENELTKFTFMDITHPDDIDKDVKHSTDLMNGKILSYKIDKRYITKSKKIIWVTLTVSFIRDASKKPLYFISMIEDITARKQIEDELRLDNEIMNNISEGVCLVGINDYKIRFTNDKFDKMFGYKKGELIGKNLIILNSPFTKSPKKEIHKIAKLLKKNGELRREFRSIRKNGEIFWRYSNLSLFNHSKFGLVAVFISIDITKNKLVEDKLKRSEKEFRLMAQKSHDLITITDENATHLWVNNRWKKYFGELPYKIDPFKMIHPDDKETVIKAWAKLINGTNKEFNIEYRYLNPEGKYWFFKSNAVKVVLSNKTLFYIFASDITNRKNAEEELKISLNRLLKAQMIAKIGFIDWDIKNKSIYWSEEVYKIHNVNPKKQRATMDLTKKFVHPDDVAFVNENLKLALKGVKKYDIEHRLLLQNKKVVWVHVQADITKDEKGRPVNMLGTLVDITEKKKAKEERLKLEKAEDNFLNIVSHELKTPLTALYTNLEVLYALETNKNFNQQENKSLDAIKRNAYQLKILVNNILEVARIQAGKLEVDQSKIDLVKVIDEIIDDIIILSDKKGLTIKIKGLSNIFVRGDQILLREIFINLISNAIKFTEQGGILIQFRKKGSYAIVTVADTGVGILKSDVEKLFNKFYQVENVLKRRFGGTGLGLHIAQELVELHNGKISVESEIDKGTTFLVQLPLWR